VPRFVDTSPANADPLAGVVTVVGRHRLASDVVSELMDHLARSQARIVVCDLTGMAVPPRDMDAVFAPVASYLVAWPGTLVVVCVPNAAEHSRAVPTAIADRLLVHRSVESGLSAARGLIRPMEQTHTLLAPVPPVVSGARDFVRHTLEDWQLTDLAWPATLVVSELVTNAIRHSATVLSLTLSRVDSRFRIAVQDYGGGAPSIPEWADKGTAAQEDGRGLHLIDAETRAWGVFPARGSGKTVWALLAPP
jgi:anti-sigma regulatory factor (Ser/Thr protein kinase)